MHPTATKVQERLHARGLDVEVQVLPDSTRTAAEAAAACGCDVGQIVKSLVFVRGEDPVPRDAPAEPAHPSLSGSVEPTPVMVLCAGDRRVDAKRLGLRPASADEARAATGFAIGGVPPLGHDRELETIVDASLRRFETVWCAAGTPHAVFSVSTEALFSALPSASVADVS